MIPETISYAEGEDLYGVNYHTLRRAVLAGKIEAYKPGRTVRMVKSSADKWFLSSKIKPIGRPRKGAKR